MNARWIGRTRSSLLIAAALLALTGCQLLGKQQNQVTDSVVLGSVSASFGQVNVGNSKTIQNTLTNFKTSSVTIVSISGLDPTLQVSGISLPLVLASGQEVPFSVVFQPSAAGKISTTLSFSDGQQFLASLQVQGEGVEPGQLSFTPSSINFGNVKVGNNSASNITLSNSGSTDLNITQVSLSGAGFTIGNLSLPLTLHPGGSASLSVTFAPTGASHFTGSVNFSTDVAQARRGFRKADQHTSLSLPLSGDGVSPGMLTPSPTSEAFGSVQVGTTGTQTQTLTNTGGSPLTISQASVTGAGFSISGLSVPTTLAPNQSVVFTVKFAPAAVGAVSGNLALTSDGSNPALNVPLTGTGVAAAQLVASPTSLAFGNVQIGTSSNKSETITNNGGTAVTISQATVTGAGYSVGGVNLPATLAAGQSVVFTIMFAPTAAGAASGNLAIVSDAPGSPLNVGLSGTGVTQGQITPNPASLSFGNVLVGASKILTETLTNSGGTSVTISAATASGAGFTMTGLTVPLTLNAGQSTSFSVQFAPTVAGGVSGSVAITSNGGNPNLNIPLSGNGATPGALVASPVSLAFGSVQVGSNTTLSETLTNTGGSNVTISQATVTGSGFSITGLTIPSTLTPNQTATFTVKFTPAAGGNVNGNIAIASDAPGSPLNIPLSGTGIAPGDLTANPSSVIFGNVTVGNNKTVSVTVTNTGGATVTISNAAATGNGFSFTGPNLPATVAAGQSASFSAIFTPTAAGNSSGNLTITSDASNPTLTIPLSGVGVTPGQLAPNPASLSFGNVAVGSSKSLTETLTNSGGTSLTISAASATGTGFSMSGLTVPLTLNAGQSTTFNVQYAPTATGVVSGNVTITSDGSNPTLNISLSGTGVTAGTLSASPISLSFGNVQTGTSSSLSETVTNTGGVNVTVSQANVTGAGYSISGLTVPVTLTPSQAVTFSVKFAPTAAGAVNGTLAIISDASNSPLNIALTGTGVTPGQITPNPVSLSFGNVTLGSSKSFTETLTNSGGSSVTISSASASGSGYSISGISVPLTLTAGQSTSFTVQFAPTVGGGVNGNVTITSNGSNPTLNIALSGTGVAPGTLSANPASLSFGTVQVGSNTSLSETVTNTGGVPVTISQATVTGTGFSISGLTVPTTLNAGQSVTFTAKFTPAAPGAVSGTLAIISDASNSPLNIALSGTGGAQGQLAVTPATLNFGNVVVNASSALTGSLTATGASVTVTSGTSDNGEFALSGINFPKTIAAGQSASFTVTFTPNASGTANGNLTFISNASNSPTIEALTGNGQAPQPHTVDLTWIASQTPGVVGYNVYRRTASGSYSSPINSTLTPSTAYTDNTVAAGQTYFYVARAVDGNGVESANSNEVQAVIPTP
ncbi:MAG TPA: choice-of-anchor D domain-containing protein [Terriglobales bacterium]|nr:choice-of-anchor D domain-containing protein [Terriglobales bacterium]